MEIKKNNFNNIWILINSDTRIFRWENISIWNVFIEPSQPYKNKQN